MTEENQLEPATSGENMPAWREVFFYLVAGVLNLVFVIRPRGLRPTSASVAVITSGFGVLGSFDGIVATVFVFLPSFVFVLQGGSSKIIESPKPEA